MLYLKRFGAILWPETAFTGPLKMLGERRRYCCNERCSNSMLLYVDRYHKVYNGQGSHVGHPDFYTAPQL